MRLAVTLMLPLLFACADDEPPKPERPESGVALEIGPDGVVRACGLGYERRGDACVFTEDAIGEVMRTFDQVLEKVNARSFEQEMGPDFERNVWISHGAVTLDDGQVISVAELYAMVDPSDYSLGELPVAFPVGTVIVHETVNREEGHTVQVKLGDDAGEFADDNGRDWYFGKFFDDGLPDAVPCSPCTMCHNLDTRPGTDGLMGVPDDAL